MGSTGLRIIGIICIILFFGALVFLIYALRSRFGEPLTDAEMGDDGEDDDDYEDEEDEDGEEADEDEEVTDTGDEEPEDETQEESSGEDESPATEERSVFARPEQEEAAEEAGTEAGKAETASEEAAESASSEAPDEGLEGSDLETLFTELFEGRPEGESAPDEDGFTVTDSTVRFEDILDSCSLLSKTMEECGITDSCLSEDGSTILTEGNLFGKYAYGGIQLEKAEDGSTFAGSLYVVCHGMEFEDCKVELSKLYGRIYTSGEQVYQEDEVSVYCAWETDFGYLWLSRTGERDFINLNTSR